MQTTMTMTISMSDVITDPFLQSVLDVSSLTHEQCLLWFDATAAAHTTDRPAWEVQARLAQQQKRLSAYLSQLRGLNRDVILCVRKTKQTTADARQEVDRLHLQLQNLEYEQRHLRGEMAACEAYECVDEARRGRYMPNPHG